MKKNKQDFSVLFDQQHPEDERVTFTTQFTGTLLFWFVCTRFFRLIGLDGISKLKTPDRNNKFLPKSNELSGDYNGRSFHLVHCWVKKGAGLRFTKQVIRRLPKIIKLSRLKVDLMG